MPDLIYRFLDKPVDHIELVPLFNRRGFVLPHPQLSSVVVAQVPEGPLVASWHLQMVPHMEPLVTLPGWEAKVSIDRMHTLLEERARTMSKFVGGYIMHAAKPEYETVFRDRWGLVERDWKIFIKEF